MPTELWGASGTLNLWFPRSTWGAVFLALSFLGSAIILWSSRSQIASEIKRRYRWLLFLSIVALIVSQLFPFRTHTFLPTFSNAGPLGSFVPFALIPLLLAAATLPPGLALMVGLCTGFGTTLGQTHQITDIFIYGIVAWGAAQLIGQSIHGRAFRLLRHPLTVALLAAFLLALLHGLSFAAVTQLPPLAYLDHFLLAFQTTLPLLLIQGLIAAAISLFILHYFPELPRRIPPRPSPVAASINRQLSANSLIFAGFITGGALLLVSWLAIRVATFLVVSQLAQNTGNVAVTIPTFQQQLAAIADEAAMADFRGADAGAAEKSLAGLYARHASQYRQVFLVNPEGVVTAAYPENTPLTESELTAVADTLLDSKATLSAVKLPAGDQTISFFVPLRNEAGRVTAVLIGRAAEITLDTLIFSLQGEFTGSQGFIIDRQNKVILHSDTTQLGRDWPQAPLRTRQISGINQGALFQGWDDNGNRILLHQSTIIDQGWSVVAAAPYNLVLEQAVRISLPLLALLLVVTAGFVYTNYRMVDDNISRPLQELIGAAKMVSAGGLWRPAQPRKQEDEVGKLQAAFDEMQTTVHKQLHDMSILLSVSQDVSASLDLSKGIPALLRGALRGTNATGARAVLVSPTGSLPLTFNEGSTGEKMAALDRDLMVALRQTPELMLTSPNQIRAALQLAADAPLPVPALLAISLQMKHRFHGIVWLGYREEHGIPLSERHMLNTLGAQASVLMENTRLYVSAESGRRRLAAVLASVTDAVLVTDQTDRILLLNRTAEKLFGLQLRAVRGRVLRDVLDNEILCRAMTVQAADPHPQELELTDEDGHTHIAAISLIVAQDGQVYGRVAVLRDVTNLKEVDQMKSDFVSTVSHDLRGPLTYMRGYVTMLPMIGELNERQQKYTDKILTGIDQMSDLVNDLLDLGRIEAGVELERKPIVVKTLLQDIAAEYWQHAHFAGIKISLDIGPEVNIYHGDSELIRRSIINLLENGIKYAAQSGKMILGAQIHKNHLILRVQDNGPGIPPAAQPQLFEKFYRVKQRGTEKIKGSGLGLAIVKSIAERHGGRVSVRSQPGAGSTFFISLPLPD
jgi:PAS domain S-box-containing protein